MSEPPRQIAVVTDYNSLHAALRKRIAELQINRQEFDLRAEFQSGYAGKLFSAYPARALGRTTLGPALKVLGLALAVVEVKRIADLEPGGPARGGQPASGKSGLANLPEVRALTRQQVRKIMRKLARKGARKGGLARAAQLSPAHRRRIARKAGQASARKAAELRAAKQQSKPDVCHNPVKPPDASVAPLHFATAARPIVITLKSVRCPSTEISASTIPPAAPTGARTSEASKGEQACTKKRSTR